MTEPAPDRSSERGRPAIARDAARSVRSEALATVRDLLDVPALRLALVAGHRGLDRPIRWAHSIELLDPRPYLRGQELVLTMGSLLVDEAASRRFVAAILERDAGGIGFGCGNYHPEAPAWLRVACDDVGLPLVEVPPDVPFIAITEELAERMAVRRAEHDRRALRREAKLLDILAAGRGVEEMARVIAREVGGWVVVVGPAGSVEVAVGDPPRPDLDGLVRAALTGREIDRRASRDDGTAAADLVPIRRQGRTLGWLGWVRASGTSTGDGLELLREAAPIVSVELAARSGERTRDRTAIGRLFAIVRSGTADPIVLADRIAAAGLDPSSLVASVWPDVDPDSLGDEVGPAIVGDLDGRTCLVGGDAATIAAVATARGLPCGIGGTVALAELARSLAEAGAAADIAVERRSVATWRDLASVAALLGQQPPDRLAVFSAQLIVPLVAHDARRGADLLPTLRAFIAGEGAIEPTARRLAIHPNTLRHRLRRIRALTGRDPLRFLDRSALYIGLWAWDSGARRIHQSDGANIVDSDH